MKKQHPVAVLKYTTGYFWLLLIPLVRGFSTLKGDVHSWVRGTYIDIFILLLITLIAVFRWNNVRFEIGNSELILYRVFFVKEKTCIPFCEVSAVRTEKSFYLRPFGAVKLSIETEADYFKRNGKNRRFEFIFPLKYYTEICNKITYEDITPVRAYEASKAKLLSFCVTISSTITGLVYAGTILIQGSRLADLQLEKRLADAAESAVYYAEKVSDGFSVYAGWAVAAAAFGWLFSFVANYLRHINFRLTRQGKSIIAEGGFFSEWSCIMRCEKIIYTDMRQNLIMKFFGLVTVMISCCGYGKVKGEIPLAVPSGDKKSAGRIVEKFIPKFCCVPVEAEVKRCGILRYVGLPAAMIFGIILAGGGAVLLFPSWHRLILFCVVMGLIFTAHLYAVNLTAFCTSGAGIKDDIAGLRYCRFFQFHNVTIPFKKIVMTEIRQSLFQKRKNVCDLIVYTGLGMIKKHRIKGIDVCEAGDFTDRVNYRKGR